MIDGKVLLVSIFAMGKTPVIALCNEWKSSSITVVSSTDGIDILSKGLLNHEAANAFCM